MITNSFSPFSSHLFSASLQQQHKNVDVSLGHDGIVKVSSSGNCERLMELGVSDEMVGG